MDSRDEAERVFIILFKGLANGFQGELKMAILTWRQRPILVKIVKNSNLYHVGKWRWLTAIFVKDKLCVLQIAESWRFEDSGYNCEEKEYYNVFRGYFIPPLCSTVKAYPLNCQVFLPFTIIAKSMVLSVLLRKQTEASSPSRKKV